MYYIRENRPFSLIPTDQAAFEVFLSLPRFQTFVEASGGDRSAAVRLYRWNIQLCEALYLPLHVVEVGFRNRVCDAMTARFGGAWPLLWNSYRLRKALPEGARNKLREAAEELARRQRDVTSDRIVAAMHFGFWSRMLDRRYDRVLWRRGLHDHFLHLPPHLGRDALRSRINGIRDFRNRIFHHEPIFAKTPKRRYQEILETIGWLCPRSALLVAQMSDFERVLAARPRP